jgi:hypothetical protein
VLLLIDALRGITNMEHSVAHIAKKARNILSIPTPARVQMSVEALRKYR